MDFLGRARIGFVAVSAAGADGRLRWRCRRGMRELDQLLGWYLDSRYAQADEVKKTAFASLLEQQDPELWHWLQGHGSPDNVFWRAIVDEIRTRDRV
jgi:antitoxin CptB